MVQGMCAYRLETMSLRLRMFIAMFNCICRTWEKNPEPFLLVKNCVHDIQTDQIAGCQGSSRISGLRSDKTRQNHVHGAWRGNHVNNRGDYGAALHIQTTSTGKYPQFKAKTNFKLHLQWRSTTKKFLGKLTSWMKKNADQLICCSCRSSPKLKWQVWSSRPLDLCLFLTTNWPVCLWHNKMSWWWSLLNILWQTYWKSIHSFKAWNG